MLWLHDCSEYDLYHQIFEFCNNHIAVELLDVEEDQKETEHSSRDKATSIADCTTQKGYSANDFEELQQK